MTSNPILDEIHHERLDVYRLAIEYVTSSYRIAKSLSGHERHARDQWLRAAQSKPSISLLSPPADGTYARRA